MTSASAPTGFHSQIKHCRACGTAVVYRVPDDGDTRTRAICPQCHTVHYENPLNVVGTVPALPDGRVLLCKRNIEPRWGKWTLPAGFMEPPPRAPSARPTKRPEPTSPWARCLRC